MEGICGRMCDACTWKEQLDCPGCQDGPGRRFSGGCPIADCCREKGHTACVTCTFSTGCALRRRDMPQNRLWAVEAERERRARLDRNAPVLAKWLWLLFWLVTPSVFSNILTMDTVAGAFPTAGVVGNVLAFLISLAYGVLLWQLREAAGLPACKTRKRRSLCKNKIQERYHRLCIREILPSYREIPGSTY